jgi:hypothetical protein
MRRLVLEVSTMTQRTVKAISLPVLALLLMLVLVVAPSAAMPVPVSAAIEQRGTATTGITVNTTLTINKPPGVVAGDVMIVNIAKVGNATTDPTSVGWTLIDGRSLGDGASRGGVLYRVVDGTEQASFAFALGFGTISAVGSIVAFSGVDTSGATPFDGAPGTISVQESQTTVAASSITTTSGNAAVIMFGQGVSSPSWDGWTTASSGALTELYDNQIGGVAGASVGAAWTAKPTAGTTGDGAATLSDAERNGGILIALEPDNPTTTLTVTPANGSYGGTASLTATLSPAVAGKTINFTLNGLGAGTAVTDSSGVANIPAASLTGVNSGSYPTGVVASFAGDTGCASSSGTASLLVNPRDIQVTADSNGKVYGSADPVLTWHISSGFLVGGDAFSGDVARVAGEGVGTYVIQRGSLALSSNYNLTFVKGAFNIRLRPLVVTADSLSKTYGDTTSFAGTEFTAEGLVGSDSVKSVTLTSDGASADAAKGSYPIVASKAVGTGLANYAITYKDGTLRVSTLNGPSPFVTSVSPIGGTPGENLSVVVTGTNLSGAVSVSFGDGVVVDSYTVDSDTQITADITIDSAAKPGENDVVVATPSGDGLLTDSFAVEISKESGEAGASSWFWWLVALLTISLALLFFVLNRRTKRTLALQPAPTLSPSRSPDRTENPLEQQVSTSSPSQLLERSEKAEDRQQEPIPTPFETTGKTEEPLKSGTPAPHRSPGRKSKKASTSRPSQSVRRTRKKEATSTSEKPRRRTKKKTTG